MWIIETTIIQYTTQVLYDTGIWRYNPSHEYSPTTLSYVYMS